VYVGQLKQAPIIIGLANLQAW